MNSIIDTSVIVVFSIFIMLIGFSFSRTGRNLKSFFAGGESVPWFIGGLSLFMSFFSAGTFVAWGSIAYKHGWVAITIQWTMCLGGLITGLYLAPKWKATGNLTAAEFIRERLGNNVQKIYIYIFMLVSLFIKGSVLYSVAKLVGSSLEFPLIATTIVLGIFMIAYTAVGGLWAVMVTDILQFVILTAAVLIIIPLSFEATGGVPEFLRKVPDNFFNVVSGEFSWGFILAFALYHIFYIGGNWTFVQRYTSVDTPKSASKVAYLFAALYIISPILWMLPPMIYKTINPSLVGLDTENAYLMICKQVLPAGLMGLILTGMYFSTSASANTALNVVSAVFTNDIYKGTINPGASDKKLMQVARMSSWIIGLGMIGVALIVPLIGGIVEFTLSIASVTGGPLLAPPIWALFSKRLTGKATAYITIVCLSVNLVFKLLLPFAIGFKLDRAEEMLLGVGLPFILLALYELYMSTRMQVSGDYEKFLIVRSERKEMAQAVNEEEAYEIKKQNRFGLRVISFALAFIAFLLYILSLLTVKGGSLVAIIATIILAGSLIPLRGARKVIIKPTKIIGLFIFLLAGFQLSAQKKKVSDYKIIITTDKEDPFYKANEKVTFTVKLTYLGEPVTKGQIKWKISKDGLEPPLQQGVGDLEKGSFTVSGKLNEPGFLQCRGDFSVPGVSVPTGRASAAIDPLLIKPSLPPPSDFNKYWDANKKKLASIPMNIRITPVKSPVAGVECFDVQADCLGKPMSAYMARPIGAKPKSLPATVLLHGSGVASSRLSVVAGWAKDGLLALDFNAHGLPNGLPQQYYSGLYKDSLYQYYMKNPASKDSVFFYGLFMRLMRAMDVLTAQPEWDQKILIANGRSQGGAQAIAAAGLDKRVTFFAAQIPALCDHTGVAAGRINGWPKLISFDENNKPDEKTLQAVRYIDAMNFAANTSAAAFFTVGFIDISCPPTGVYATYNNIKGKKNIINYYHTGHVATAEADSLVRLAVLDHIQSFKKTTASITGTSKKSVTAASAFYKMPAPPISEEVFRKPPGNKSKPLTWWHWINGNITKEGIRKDLVDMKKTGIGGVQMFDTHMYLPPGPIRYGTKEWYDHVRFAMQICDSLDLEFYVTNSPGWSGSGGPWVTVEKSMKKLVFSETEMSGTVSQIPKPESHKGFYRDVAVLAVRSDNKLIKDDELLKKTGMFKMPFLPKAVPNADTVNALQQKDIINISRYFDTTTEKLTWKSPAGSWTILRFGYTSTGAHVHPAVVEGSGYEVDKLDTNAVVFQYNQSVGRMIKEAGAYTGKTFKGILFDSFEGGFQNWTGTMPLMFKNMKGYDLINYLPVLAGRKVGSDLLSAAFLWDFNDALTRLFATNYYGTMQKLAHKNNLVLFAEGQGGPMSPSFVDAYADVPMNEFWTGGNITGRANQIKQSVSIANVLGKTMVAAESFTSRPEHGKWQNTPYLMKRTGDYAFVYGINKFIFHTYTHQPFNLEPGFTMGRYGAHFGRTNTWWTYAPAWIDYLSRSQYLLQQGRMVADVCYLFPRDAIYEFTPGTPKIPEGYNYDIVYPDYLATMKSVNAGLMLPSGAFYKLLVLPEYGYMSYSTLKDVYRLLEAGCTVSGPAPKASPDMEGVTKYKKEFDELVQNLWGNTDGKKSGMASVGKGKLYYGKPLAEVLKELSLNEDLKFTNTKPTDTLRYIHRNTGDADIYFISNQTDNNTTFNAVFRVDGKQPELWDPVTGKTMPAERYDMESGNVKVPLTLAPSGSMFVIFRSPAVASTKKMNTDDKKSAGTMQAVKGTWTVEFKDGRGAPPKISMPELISWSMHPDSSVRYYSGKAAYTNSFTLSKEQVAKNRTFKLNLGDIADIGEVIINGKQAGTVWTKPYEADISAFVKEGRNELKIIIANRWINRLIGDENIPAEYNYQNDSSKFTTGRILTWPEWFYDASNKKENKRYTFTTWKHYSAGDPLVPSGLLGPVTLNLAP